MEVEVPRSNVLRKGLWVRSDRGLAPTTSWYGGPATDLGPVIGRVLPGCRRFAACIASLGRPGGGAERPLWLTRC